MVEAEVKLEEKIDPSIGRGRAKALESRNALMRKKLRFTAEVVEAAKRRNDILQPQ